MNLKDEYKGRGWRRNGRKMSMRRRMDGLRMRIGGEGEEGKDDGSVLEERKEMEGSKNEYRRRGMDSNE